jgi:RNA polymerase sigma-70 factor (ECF subfamily)
MSPEGEATSLLDTQESTELPAPDALAEREKIERVRQAVSNLSDEERRLVTAYYWKDRTQSDIAQELGLDQGTIGRRLAKVEQSLRKALE